jgi:hypothetical protein
VYELPSLPATVTAVAFDAVTVSVVELPAIMEVGSAVIATVVTGLETTVTVMLAITFPAFPVAVAV